MFLKKLTFPLPAWSKTQRCPASSNAGCRITIQGAATASLLHWLYMSPYHTPEMELRDWGNGKGNRHLEMKFEAQRDILYNTEFEGNKTIRRGIFNLTEGAPNQAFCFTQWPTKYFQKVPEQGLLLTICSNDLLQYKAVSYVHIGCNYEFTSSHVHTISGGIILEFGDRFFALSCYPPFWCWLVLMLHKQRWILKKCRISQ